MTFIPHPTPLRDASGRMVGATNMLVDISERKQAERALRRQADLSNSPLTRSSSGDSPVGIEFWNKGAAFSTASSAGSPWPIARDLLRTRHPRPWAEIEAELRERGLLGG